jgi:hypothetical protein
MNQGSHDPERFAGFTENYYRMIILYVQAIKSMGDANQNLCQFERAWSSYNHAKNVL